MNPSYLLRPEVVWSCHNKAPPPLAAIREARSGGCIKTELQDHFGSLPFAKRVGSISLLLRVTSCSWLQCVSGDRYWSTGNCIAAVSARGKKPPSSTWLRWLESVEFTISSREAVPFHHVIRFLCYFDGVCWLLRPHLQKQAATTTYSWPQQKLLSVRLF